MDKAGLEPAKTRWAICFTDRCNCRYTTYPLCTLIWQRMVESNGLTHSWYVSYRFQDDFPPLGAILYKIPLVNYSPVFVPEGLYHQAAIIRLSAQPDRSRWSTTVLFGFASVWSCSEYFIGLLPVSFRCPQLPRHVDLMTGTSSTLSGALRRSAYGCDCSFTKLEGHTRFELVTCVSKTQVISVSPTALKNGVQSRT